MVEPEIWSVEDKPPNLSFVKVNSPTSLPVIARSLGIVNDVPPCLKRLVAVSYTHLRAHET